MLRGGRRFRRATTGCLFMGLETSEDELSGRTKAGDACQSDGESHRVSSTRHLGAKSRGAGSGGGSAVTAATRHRCLGSKAHDQRLDAKGETGNGGYREGQCRGTYLSNSRARRSSKTRSNAAYIYWAARRAHAGCCRGTLVGLLGDGLRIA